MREALINLLVHADYAERDVSLIIRSGDGCYFSNPGNSRIPELDLLSGRHRSDPRNPVLLLMFRMIGLADEAGTGIPKIMAGWRQLGYQPPSVEVDTDRYEFVLCLRYAHLLSDDDRAWLRALGDNWSEPERLALVYARHEGDVDNFRLRQLTGQHPADVTKVLGGLRDRGLLEMTGGKRGARYQLGPAAMSGVSGPKPPELLPKPPELLPKPPELLPKPPELLPKPPESAPDPRELWSDLEAIAGQVRGQRYTAATARDRVVVELCAHTPLSLRDLALLLGRSQEYVRKVVGPLLTSGRLMYLYPDQPNHPRQKYVAGPKAQDFIEGAPLSS
jgi:ATP-dependent DNA helicase RecG